MAKKSDKAEIDRRIHAVVKMLSVATPTYEICSYAKEAWGVSESQARRYVARAREIIKEEYSVERSHFLGRQLAILDKVIESSIASGQHSNAIGALKLQAELTRLLDR